MNAPSSRARGVGLLEREYELAALSQTLTQARAGTGGAVMVWGAAGIGKSSLMAAARTAAVSADMLVLRARGAELEREFGFGVVRQLFEPVLAGATEGQRKEWLDGAAGDAAGVLGLPGAETVPLHDAPVDPSFAVLHGLYWLCVQMSSTQPLLLIVDDAQWADLASLRFLAFLLTRIEESPVAVAAAIRAGEEGPATDLLSALTSAPVARVIEPGSLTRSGVERLLSELLEQPAEQALVTRCLLATGGTPFLVEQYAAQLADEASGSGELSTPTPVGPALARWVRARLARLGPQAGRLADAAAIMESGTLAHVADLAGMSFSEASAAWDGLVQAQLLDVDPPVTFRHPLVRRAAYDGIGRAEREAGHRRAAQLLVATGAAPQVAAEHLLAVQPAGDDHAVSVLVAAAESATTSGAHDSAITFLRRALAEPPAADARAGILLALGVAEFYNGDPSASSHLRQSTELAVGPDRAVAATMMAYALGGGSAPELLTSIAVLDSVAESFVESDPATVMTLETAAASISTLDADVAHVDQARIRAARARGDQPGASRGAAALAAIIAAQGNEPAATAAALAHRALRTPSSGACDVIEGPVIDIHIAMALVWSEDPAARGVLEKIVADAQTSSNPVLLAVAQVYRAWCALNRGDVLAAEADGRSVLDSASAQTYAYFRTLGLSLAAEALVLQARFSEAGHLLVAEAPPVERATSAVARLGFTRGRLHLAEGRPQEALTAFLAAGDIARRLELDSPGWLPWRSSAALACLALGDHERAAELAGAELAMAQVFGAPRALGAALRTAALTTAGARGEDMLREAATVLASCGADLDAAQALYELGARLRRGNRRAESRVPLRSAIDIAHRLGAHGLTEVATVELRAAGARPRARVASGPDTLSASERRVVDLAVDGLTNRQIAQRLFVTDRTVEGHLTHAFRKLDISSRDQLGDALTN